MTLFFDGLGLILYVIFIKIDHEGNCNGNCYCDGGDDGGRLVHEARLSLRE